LTDVGAPPSAFGANLASTMPYSDGPTNPHASAQPTPRLNTTVAFEDETQARPVDDYLLQAMRDDDRSQGELNVPYESLPSLEARRPFDTYEAEFAERDPVTQMVAAHESIRLRRAQQLRVVPQPREERWQHEDAYPQQQEHYPQQQAEHYPQPQQAEHYPQQEEHYPQDAAYGPPTTREGSGARERPYDDRDRAYEEPAPAPRDYAAPLPPFDDVHESNHPSFQSGPQARGWSDPPPRTEIPPAPAVPREMRFHTPPAFIQGVQPIRPANNYTAQSVMTPPPQMAPQQQPMYPQQPMHSMQVQQQQPMYPSMSLQQQQRMMATTPSSAYGYSMPMQPVGPSIAPQQKNGIGRFAWFVFGAAFGIAFAFVATGYVPRIGQPDPLFPPAPPRPAATAVQAVPPQPVSAPPPSAPPPAATTATTAVTPSALPPAPPATGASTSARDPKPPAPPTTGAAAKPPPPPRRFFAPPPRRPAPPAANRDDSSPAPKKIGGSVDAPDSSPPPAASEGAGLNNILGDALKP
jgi:hypothetical protein